MRAAYPIPIPIRAARCPSIPGSRDDPGKDIVCFPIYTSADTIAEASRGRLVPPAVTSSLLFKASET